MEIDIVITISVLVAGLYMLGVGYSVAPSPGAKDSVKNEEHLNKHRKILKTGGFLSVAYVVLQVIYTSLANVQ